MDKKSLLNRGPGSLMMAMKHRASGSFGGPRTERKHEGKKKGKHSAQALSGLKRFVSEESREGKKKYKGGPRTEMKHEGKRKHKGAKHEGKHKGSHTCSVCGKTHGKK